MADFMSLEKCRELQGECSKTVRVEIAKIRDALQSIDREWVGGKLQIQQALKNLEALEKIVADMGRGADEKYAGKTSEKIVYAVVALICVAVVTALVQIVVKK